MELFYQVSTMKNIRLYKKHLSSKNCLINNQVYWTMKTGEKIKVSDMTNSHLRNSILLVEKKYQYLQDSFEKLLVKYSIEDIYLMNFSPNKSQTKDIEEVFKLNPVYFYMRREEIYRMHVLSRKILQYAEKRKIDYYGTN